MTLNELMMSLEIGLIYGMVALGIYLTFRVMDFSDLTCDGSFVLGSAVSTLLIKSGINPWVSLMGALLAGGIAGMTTALLHIKFRVTRLLSGILVSSMLYSINLRIMGGTPNISLMDEFTLFSTIPIIQLIFIGLSMCAFLVYLLMTDFGLSLRSIGQNKILAHNSGINVSQMTLIGLALSNGLVALGGALFSQHQGFADVGSGIGSVIVGLASVMIGEKIMPFRSITLKIISCLMGSILYRLLITFALRGDFLGLTTADLNLITGIMIIIIMYMPRRQAC